MDSVNGEGSGTFKTIELNDEYILFNNLIGLQVLKVNKNGIDPTYNVGYFDQNLKTFYGKYDYNGIPSNNDSNEKYYLNSNNLYTNINQNDNNDDAEWLITYKSLYKFEFRKNGIPHGDDDGGFGSGGPNGPGGIPGSPGIGFPGGENPGGSWNNDYEYNPGINGIISYVKYENLDIFSISGTDLSSNYYQGYYNNLPTITNPGNDIQQQLSIISSIQSIKLGFTSVNDVLLYTDISNYISAVIIDREQKLNMETIIIDESNKKGFMYNDSSIIRTKLLLSSSLNDMNTNIIKQNNLLGKSGENDPLSNLDLINPKNGDYYLDTSVTPTNPLRLYEYYKTTEIDPNNGWYPLQTNNNNMFFNDGNNIYTIITENGEAQLTSKPILKPKPNYQGYYFGQVNNPDKIFLNETIKSLSKNNRIFIGDTLLVQDENNNNYYTLYIVSSVDVDNNINTYNTYVIGDNIQNEKILFYCNNQDNYYSEKILIVTQSTISELSDCSDFSNKDTILYGWVGDSNNPDNLSKYNIGDFYINLSTSILQKYVKIGDNNPEWIVCRTCLYNYIFHNLENNDNIKIYTNPENNMVYYLDNSEYEYMSSGNYQGYYTDNILSNPTFQEILNTLETIKSDKVEIGDFILYYDIYYLEFKVKRLTILNPLSFWDVIINKIGNTFGFYNAAKSEILLTLRNNMIRRVFITPKFITTKYFRSSIF